MPFLRFITRSRYHAIGVSSLSLLVPAFGLLFSLAIIGLATLLHGVKEGIGVGVATALLTLLSLWLFSQNWVTFHLPWHLSMIFMVVIACGALRIGRSWGNLLALATALAAIGIVIVHLQAPDRVEYGDSMLLRNLPSIEGMPAPSDGSPAGETIEAPADASADSETIPIDLSASPIVGILMATIVIALFATMCMARYAQALLVNPGGFGREFRTLDLGRRFTIATSALLVMAFLFSNASDPGIFQDLFILAASMYIVQGIALAHALVRIYRLRGPWLLLMYLGIFLGPFLVPGLALVINLTLLLAGFSDTWMNYRARLAHRA